MSIPKPGTLGFGDFRMNMLCNTLMGEIRSEVGHIGACLRPEVSVAFTSLLEAIKELDRVTEEFLRK